VHWDATSVEALPRHRLRVTLAGGQQGIFDMTPYLDRGIFRELRDPNYFKQVGIVFGAVTWPHEQDIAPETLLAELQPIDC
jgi:hypothetical protein